jgi:hypothetical protein
MNDNKMPGHLPVAVSDDVLPSGTPGDFVAVITEHRQNNTVSTTHNRLSQPAEKLNTAQSLRIIHNG